MSIILKLSRARSPPVGWGVYCPDPWKWGNRMYRQRRDAEALAARMDPGFVVAFGSCDEEQDMFFMDVNS